MSFPRLVAATTLLLIATSALAQRRAFVESIEPDFGEPAGGTTVTIRGKNLYPAAPPAKTPVPLCTPCPARPPEVLFGGKFAEIVSYTDEQLVVKTPPNAGGAYDVQIGSAYHAPVVFPRAFRYGTHTDDRVLVPVVADRVPGAFGSIWTTELVGRDENDRNTVRPVLQHNGAAFLYHDHLGDDATRSRLPFNLRVRDLSRQADSWGTEVPLVRVEDAFINTRMDMLNIPFEAESRVTLRIYDLDGETGGDVPVFIRDNESDAQLAWTIVHMPGGEFLDRPAVPGHVSLDVRALVGDATGVERIRIQVGEKHMQKRLWSMVSITDLETQQVTIVTP